MKRSFFYLAVLTLFALLVVVWLAPNNGQPEQLSGEDLLLPEVAAQINNVTRVEIVTAGDQVVASLQKGEGQWQLEQMGGYRVDWPKLQSLLKALAQSKVIEHKTDKPEYYARLGVEDIAVEGAGSVLVRISIGDQTTGILMGNEAQGRPGQYVRLRDAAGSVLVDRVYEVSRLTLDWADSTIIDVNASEVAEVEIIHPAAERILVMRISADQTDFDLARLPQDREIRGSWAVNSLGSVFTLLSMEGVRPEDEVDWTEAVKLRLLMFSGVEILADLVVQEDEYLMRLSASHPAASVVAEDSVESVDQQELEKQAAIDIAKRVDDINLKTGGWAYGISKQKFDAMVKKPEDLLKPLESP
jgi:hypothetical protein